MADLVSFCSIGQVARDTAPGGERVANSSWNFFSFASYGLGCIKTAAGYWTCS